MPPYFKMDWKSVIPIQLVFRKLDAVPKFFKARPVPFSQIDAVKEEIDGLIECGVIKPVKNREQATLIVVEPKPRFQGHH